MRLKQRSFWRWLCDLLVLGSFLSIGMWVLQTPAAACQTATVNWRQPSEPKPYPKLKQYQQLWLDVSIKDQRVYVKNNHQLLYTMAASTGSGNSTPTGTYHIQAERGRFFYNKKSGEGARYWVSWKDHGVYLFHTVPTDKDGHYVSHEAQQLGHKAASHGCIRLSVADAKWLYEQVPQGTKVVIRV